LFDVIICWKSKNKGDEEPCFVLNAAQKIWMAGTFV